MSASPWIPNIDKPHRGHLWLCSERLRLTSTVPPSAKWGVRLFWISEFKLFLGHKFTTLSTIHSTPVYGLVRDRNTDWCGRERCKFNLFSSWNGCLYLFLCMLEPQNAQHKCKCCDKFYERWTFIKWGTIPFKAFCVVCNSSFNIENDGKPDINQYMLTAEHGRCRISSTGTKDSEKKIMYFFKRHSDSKD